MLRAFSNARNHSLDPLERKFACSEPMIDSCRFSATSLLKQNTQAVVTAAVSGCCPSPLDTLKCWETQQRLGRREAGSHGWHGALGKGLVSCMAHPGILSVDAAWVREDRQLQAEGNAVLLGW